MPIIADKYRGTTLYQLVYAELIAAARYRGTVTYQEIASIMGLPLSGNHMGKEVGYILGEVSEDEVKQGRPMLSSVAVGVSGEPGDGFYVFAAELNKSMGNTVEEKRKFWRAERKATNETWQKMIK